MTRTAAFLIIVILAVFSINSSALSKSKKQTEIVPPDTSNPAKILIADIEYGANASVLDDIKVEAAFNLACNLTRRYILIPFGYRDSVANDMKHTKDKPTAASVAKNTGADRIYFVRISLLANMLRVDISSASLKNGKKTKKGIGYADINYRERNTEKPLYDPSLLKAIQRALADVENDSLMFDKCEQPFKVFPAPTLVIGGIDFKDDPNLKQWDLYLKKMSTSFDATEVIFENIRNAPNFVVYDMETRDSIYALFNMHIVENYHPPTSHEMEALISLDVDYYITGLLNRVAEGAKLDLYICRLKNKSLDIVNQETGLIQNDDIDEMREVVKEMTKKLLKLN